MTRGTVSHVFVACLATAGCDSASLNMGPSDMSMTTEPTGPVVIASGQQAPVAIAVDGANIYWMNLGTNPTTDAKAPRAWTGGQILRCPVGGCGGAPLVLASNLTQGSVQAPAAFASDGQSLYWSTLSGVERCGLAGCGDQPQALSQQETDGLAVFQGTLYWTQFAAELYDCPVGGCGGSVTTLWSAGYSPCDVGVAVDASGIYWVAQGPATLYSCPLGGCGGTPTTLMASTETVAAAREVALDANNVYFTDGNPMIGMIVACAKSGCGPAPTVLASALDAPVGITTDGINVYWTETGPDFLAGSPVTGTGSVRKCAVGGCGNAPINIATGLTSPGAIALDDAYVYWTEAGATADGGNIWKAPK